MSRVACAALWLFLGVASYSCAAPSAAIAPVALRERASRIEDAFDGEPALLVVIRPAKLARDPLYGPLVRRASQLASAQVAVSAAVGTTALAVIERTDEVIVGAYDRDARDAVVALRGVPADVEPSRLLDTEGKPLWVHLRDLPGGVEELATTARTADAELFALPRRAWVIAVGGAVARTRAAYEGGAAARLGAGSASASGGAWSISVDDGPLAVARVRGDALVRARPSLADGLLAPLVRGLDVVTLSLEPGPEGAVGEVVARFVYAELAFAERAAPSIDDVLAAFVHKFEAKAPWLHAVKVSRDERAVLVKGRIPRAWADGLIHIDLDDLAK